MEEVKKYCSIDLELTGFDPTRDEILEVGFAFFTVSDQGINITEEWNQVFKPSGTVHPKILGLTGISEAELQSAPKFSEYQELLQQKLGEAILVGHNIVLDVRFLEAFGITLSGQTIDTLDLAQWILPTHHSYNLENLMHTLGASHKEAHRALADCKATIVVLERLLQIYESFPQVVHEKAQHLLVGQSFLWTSFLNLNLPIWELTNKSVTKSAASKANFSLKPKTVNILPLEENLNQQALLALKEKGGKSVLVLNSSAAALELWRKEGVPALFPVDLSFSETKFTEFLAKDNLSRDEALFLLKVLVWRYTNWQHETILDLNLSFFGGQFRSTITEQSFQAVEIGPLVCTDPNTFLSFAETGAFHEHFACYLGLSRFEHSLSSKLGARASWNKAIRSLHTLYNPQTGIGNQNLKNDVLGALAATDLFFGIVLTVLKRLFSSGSYVKQEDLTKEPYDLQRLTVSAEHYVEKLKDLSQKIKLKDIADIITALEDFFGNGENKVRWIEFSESACVFFSQPLLIDGEAQKVIEQIAEISFVDDSFFEPGLKFSLARLGLKFKITQHHQMSQHIQIELSSKVAKQEDLLELVDVKHLPTVLVFPTLTEVKRFYDSNYSKLKEVATIFAERYSGGSSKIANNFGINTHSLLLATPHFLRKLYQRRLNVSTLAILTAHSKGSKHPYDEALLFVWKKKFPNLNELLHFVELENIIKICYSKTLKQLVFFGGGGSENQEKFRTFFIPLGEIQYERTKLDNL